MPSLPPADETLIALTFREIDALVEVIDFELIDVPDDFWTDETRAALASTLAKLKEWQRP